MLTTNRKFSDRIHYHCIYRFSQSLHPAGAFTAIRDLGPGRTYYVDLGVLHYLRILQNYSWSPWLTVVSGAPQAASC